MKRPALQNKQVVLSRMAFRARKVLGTFEKQGPERDSNPDLCDAGAVLQQLSYIRSAGRTRYFARSATRALPSSRALREISRSPRLSHKAPVMQADHRQKTNTNKQENNYFYWIKVNIANWIFFEISEPLTVKDFVKKYGFLGIPSVLVIILIIAIACATGGSRRWVLHHKSQNILLISSAWEKSIRLAAQDTA